MFKKNLMKKEVNTYKNDFNGWSSAVSSSNANHVRVGRVKASNQVN